MAQATAPAEPRNSLRTVKMPLRQNCQAPGDEQRCACHYGKMITLHRQAIVENVQRAQHKDRLGKLST